MISAAVFVLALGAADLKAAAGLDPDMCRIVRISASGDETQTPPRRPYVRPAGLSTHTSSTSGGAAHSAVSASSSSSSSSGGEGGGESTVSVNGRTVRTTYDNQGCTIVVDERPGQGE